MSSMRNAVQRRNHRERAQPTERQKWGLLEKGKDYKLRAADHKQKRRKLKALQHKAADRNDDEFYFGMMSAESKGGIKVAKRGEENQGGGKVLSEDVVKLMKTQDVGYLRTVLQQTRRERERLAEEVVGGMVGVEVNGSGKGGRKVVFGDDDEAVPSLPAPSRETQDDDMDGWLEEEDGSSEDDATKKDLTPQQQRKQHTLGVRRRKLEALKSRERDLGLALNAVEAQRDRMNGNSAGGVNKNGTSFKARERKR